MAWVVDAVVGVLVGGSVGAGIFGGLTYVAGGGAAAAGVSAALGLVAGAIVGVLAMRSWRVRRAWRRREPGGL